MDAYYKEHSAELDTFTYQAYLVPVSTEAGTDAEGNTEAVSYTHLDVYKRQLYAGICFCYKEILPHLRQKSNRQFA